MRLTARVVIVIAAAPVTASAQRLQPPFASVTFRQAPGPRVDSVSDGAMVGGAILGGAGGLFLGAIAGANLERGLSHPCGEWCGLGGAILGGLGGESAGVALGAHLAGGGKGSYVSELAASAGILVAGAFVASAADRGHCGCGGNLFVFGVPIAQIAASIAIEHATAKRDP